MHIFSSCYPAKKCKLQIDNIDIHIDKGFDHGKKNKIS